jgi:ElaB/YqjD/DUF883 family membrane-anchored ribosome-binding protein
MAREETNNVQSELAELKDDFAKLREDVGDLLKAVVDAGKSSGHDAAERVQHRLEQARDAGVESRRQVEHQIEEHPWTSVGVALSAGMLIGFLLRR